MKTAAATSYLVEGQMSYEIDRSAPGQIMYMPAGKSTIYCRVNGEPKEIDVNVTAKTAKLLQDDLEELMAKAQAGKQPEPFIDFHHKGEDSAAIPKRFVWKPDGVYLELEWTEAGKSSVEGRTCRYFSPTFNITSDGDPTGIPDTGPIGALTNNPAFRDMKRIAASRANAKTEKDSNMANPHAKFLKAIGDAVNFDPEDKDATWENDADNLGPRLVKHIKAMQKEMEGSKAKAEKADKDKEDMKEEKEKAESALAELHKQSAEQVVDAAIAAGKIPGKNDKIKAFYVQSYLADPEGMKEVLEAMNTRSVFTPVIKVTGAERTEATARAEANHAAGGTQDPDRATLKAQRAVIAKVKAANPGLDTDSVFALASAQYPEFFVQE